MFAETLISPVVERFWFVLNAAYVEAVRMTAIVVSTDMANMIFLF